MLWKRSRRISREISEVAYSLESKGVGKTESAGIGDNVDSNKS